MAIPLVSATASAAIANAMPTLNAAAPQMTGVAQTAPAPFSALFRDAVANVQGLEQQAASNVEGLIRGDGVDVHSAMIATQKADLAFEMTLSVRNKAVAAYQQLMGLQF